MIYHLEYTERARKDLKKLDKETARRVIRALRTIRRIPIITSKNSKAHDHSTRCRRSRIGLYYRAILSIHDNVLVILVLEIEDRKQAYRDF